MKKIIYLAIFILASFLAKGQYPVTQTLGTDSTIISVKGAIKGRTIIYSFTDTTQANTQRIKGYAGALIFTKNALWFRDSSIKRWVQILPSGNSNADTMYYRIGGNAAVPTPCVGCDPKFGFKGNNAINVITNNTTRFIIPADGFSALSSTDSKYLGVDTVTGNMGYLSGGGGGGSGWELTGNAISSGQFIGTTNNQDLVFKRNNVNSGIISSSSTALGRFSLSNLGSGISNSAFGSNSLSSLTSGANNSSFGSFSMQENTSGSTNSAFGSRALNINNTGNSNTALGSGAMSYNLTGSNNTSLGFESLGENITGNNNLGLGFRAGYHSDYNPSNKLFINSLDRLTSVGDSTLSIIYGVQDSLVANQRLKINGKFHINDGTQGAGKVFTDVNGDGIGSWVSPTSGGTDTSTTVGFGLTKTIAGNVINLKVDTSQVVSTNQLKDTVGRYTYWVNIKNYGAVGDGTTNDYAALAAAVATGKSVYIPVGTFLITPPSINGVTLNNGQKVFGTGFNSILKTTSNNVILRMADDCEVRDIKFVGGGSGNPYQGGIFSYQNKRGKIYNCYFEDFVGDATDFYYGGGVAISEVNSSAPFYNGFKISNCTFRNNAIGLYLSRRGEYTNVNNCHFLQNTIGANVSAGNYAFSNCIVTENGTGFKFVNDLNSGHGAVTGCLVNHNTTNVYIDGLQEGHTFTGCMFYVGNIAISNSKLVKFTSCDLGYTTSTLTNNTLLQITNSRYDVAPAAGANSITLVSGETYAMYNNFDIADTKLNVSGTATIANIPFVGGTADTVLTRNATTNQIERKLAASGGISSLSAIGSTPNANGATITGSALNLQPADSTYGGVLSTVAQKIRGEKTLTDNLTINSNKLLINNTAAGGAKPPLIEFTRYESGVFKGKGSIGYGGSNELNNFLNLDYTNGVHLYYDSTKPALWTYMYALPAFGTSWGLQWVKEGHTNNNIFNLYGKEIFRIDNIPHTSTGEAVQGGSKLQLQEVDFMDGAYGGGYSKLKYNAGNFYIQTATKLFIPSIRVANGGSEYTDATATATYKSTGANNYFIYANEDNSISFNSFRYLKNKAGSYNLGAGQKVFEYDINGGLGYFGARANSDVPDGFSNVDFYFKTRNNALSNSDRFIISSEGNVSVTNLSNGYVKASGGTGTFVSSAAIPQADVTNLTTDLGNRLQSSNFVYNEEFTGSTSSTYTLANTPIAGKLVVFKNGLKLPNSEFSLSGAVVTLTSARLSGDIFSNDYIK